MNPMDIYHNVHNQFQVSATREGKSQLARAGINKLRSGRAGKRASPYAGHSDTPRTSELGLG